MAGLIKPWVPLIGDRVKIQSVPIHDEVDASRRHRGRLGTVLEYQPSGERALEQYAVLPDGDRVTVYFPATELDPFTE